VKTAKLSSYVVFCITIALVCYFRPSTDDFDRYIYEALIRSPRQPIAEIYQIVKHESPRAEASSIMDSPDHLAQLQPLYAIRPLYIDATALANRLGLSPQRAISFVSAISLMLCALVIGLSTERYLYSALLVCTPGILVIGRMGTPDALSSFVLVAACILAFRDKLFLGVLLLMISVWIRTDNVLFVLAVLAWMAWNKQLLRGHAIVLSVLAVSSVFFIDHFSGNYGWKVLFHYSFIGGKYPAEIVPHLTVWVYLKTFVENGVALGPQIAPGLLLAGAAMALKAPQRQFLLPIVAACILHYLLFPSGEARYLAWAYMLTGSIFVRSLGHTEKPRSLFLAAAA
jgi:hypothetical protein